MSQPNITTLHLATISHLSHDGRGIAYLNGKITFLFNALPGEAVLFHYIKFHKQFDEGIAVEIKKQAMDRVNPPCPHFTICGGCSLQHMPEAMQLTSKQQIVLDLISHQTKLPCPPLSPPLTSKIVGYRHKARMGVKYVEKKEALLVGFREKKNNFIADIKQCAVLHPSVGKNIEAIKTFIASLSVYRFIPQIEIAVGDDETALIIRHLKELSVKDLALLRQFAKEHTYKIYLQAKGVDSIYLFYPEKSTAEMKYTLPALNLSFYFKPWQFTQINPEINQKMVQQALDWLSLNKNDIVLDAFSGIGNFTLPMALFCQTVIGVEGDALAVQQAKENAKINQLKNVNFYSSNLFDNIDHEPWVNFPFTKLLLDPPRSGAKAFLNSLKFKPDTILYISCNPATLARDAALLTAQGYQLSRLCVLDMFPHTQHIETMVLFKRGP